MTKPIKNTHFGCIAEKHEREHRKEQYVINNAKVIEFVAARKTCRDCAHRKTIKFSHKCVPKNKFLASLERICHEFTERKQ